jgi:hypothetical protein
VAGSDRPLGLWGTGQRPPWGDDEQGQGPGDAGRRCQAPPGTPSCPGLPRRRRSNRGSPVGRVRAGPGRVYVGDRGLVAVQAQLQPSAPLDAGQAPGMFGDVPGPEAVAAARRPRRVGAMVLAAALRASVRGWQAHKGRRQADQAAGVSARLLPTVAFAAATWPAAKRLPCSELTRPPGIRGFALCLPLTEREPLSLRGSRVAEHDRMEVRGRQRERDLACG